MDIQQNTNLKIANNKIYFIVAGATVVLVAVTAAFLFLQNKKTAPISPSVQERQEQPVAEEEKPASLGEEIFEDVESSKTTEKLPETNPFEKKVNPFTEVYKNPFE